MNPLSMHGDTPAMWAMALEIGIRATVLLALAFAVQWAVGRR